MDETVVSTAADTTQAVAEVAKHGLTTGEKWSIAGGAFVGAIALGYGIFRFVKKSKANKAAKAADEQKK